MRRQVTDAEKVGTFTRVEVIDHTMGGHGREYVKWNDVEMKITLMVQDEGRTLKIFLQETPKEIKPLMPPGLFER